MDFFFGDRPDFVDWEGVFQEALPPLRDFLDEVVWEDVENAKFLRANINGISVSYTPGDTETVVEGVTPLGSRLVSTLINSYVGDNLPEAINDAARTTAWEIAMMTLNLQLTQEYAEEPPEWITKKV
jgi:hypothetical protein